MEFQFLGGLLRPVVAESDDSIKSDKFKIDRSEFFTGFVRIEKRTYPFFMPVGEGNPVYVLRQSFEDVELLGCAMVSNPLIGVFGFPGDPNQIRFCHSLHQYIGAVHVKRKSNRVSFVAVSPFQGGAQGRSFMDLSAAINSLEPESASLELEPAMEIEEFASFLEELAS